MDFACRVSTQRSVALFLFDFWINRSKASLLILSLGASRALDIDALSLNFRIREKFILDLVVVALSVIRFPDLLSSLPGYMRDETALIFNYKAKVQLPVLKGTL